MIKVYGSSDDLIEIEGDIEEEFAFNSKNSSEFRLLVFSDRTVLRIFYDDDGIWRINRVKAGDSKYLKIEGSVENDTPDMVTLSAHIEWVILGIQYVSKEKKHG